MRARIFRIFDPCRHRPRPEITPRSRVRSGAGLQVVGEDGDSTAARERAVRLVLVDRCTGTSVRFGMDAERARDLTQDFFVFVLHRRSVLGKADRGRGRFRSIHQDVPAALPRRRTPAQHGAKARWWRRMRYLPRRGEILIRRRDSPRVLADPGHTPAEVLDILWRRRLVEGALERDATGVLGGASRELTFNVFADIFLVGRVLPTTSRLLCTPRLHRGGRIEPLCAEPSSATAPGWRPWSWRRSKTRTNSSKSCAGCSARSESDE